MTTIYDVARLAGVSPKTVSRVLNNDAPVKDATRQAVQQAMAELGYVPSLAARALRSQRSGLIGVITGNIAPMPQEVNLRGLPDTFLVQGTQKAANDAGKTLMVADTGGTADGFVQLVRLFQQYRAEGIIYVSEFHQEIELPTLPECCPIVLLNCFDQKHTPAVLPDDAFGQYELVCQILAQGHRRIAYITLPENIIATQLRLQGYRAALAEANIAFDEKLVATGYTDRSNNIQDLWQALDRVLNQPNPPTALCCGNDEMAMRVYGMLRTQGIRVPQAMSVAGYDNHSQIAEALYPELTTAELPYVEMGRKAVKLLLEKQQHQTTPHCVQGETIWRNSVLPRHWGQ
ncbi:LacI family DNA-binding transcriptional regulator [Alysiella filiformis]|uniref:Transcriptional regulator, LacI family n=1 Tax=Alysiella filiformis DSM 16848 TaxID=1120981 RepID=A0A286EDX8_9NEIS|nr:LacI family DNA-binding transcriptional regulator [Alysiella filiformis]QMT31679.1 LacI family DNA-binding transcriptional regulator [Alysiella filiformis]UBQ55311.1 LacI family DNA-binding transcriptional regulator [Alysiella filiformis DSM 16848]SOD69079.1 transcriptional regulator, LacI family [Alysiella filiformis DSM 16848]